MIDDIIEDGKTEEEAVLEMGDVNTISAQIIRQTPFLKIAKEKIASKHNLTEFEIVLLILGAPIWLSLLIAGFAVVLSLNVTLWAVIISLFASVFAVAISAIAGIVYGIILTFMGNVLTGLSVFGASLVLGGISILLYYLSVLVSKGATLLLKYLSVAIKKAFKRKGE